MHFNCSPDLFTSRKWDHKSDLHLQLAVKSYSNSQVGPGLYLVSRQEIPLPKRNAQTSMDLLEEHALSAVDHVATDGFPALCDAVDFAFRQWYPDYFRSRSRYSRRQISAGISTFHR